MTHGVSQASDKHKTFISFRCLWPPSEYYCKGKQKGSNILDEKNAKDN